MKPTTETINMSYPTVKEWGYLENWKSTAPVNACL